MFVQVILVHVVEIAVVKVVHMAGMANRSVSAVRAMLVSVWTPVRRQEPAPC
jgi:hypothetical protein